jgi:hypothetical protein
MKIKVSVIPLSAHRPLMTAEQIVSSDFVFNDICFCCIGVKDDALNYVRVHFGAEKAIFKGVSTILV